MNKNEPIDYTLRRDGITVTCFERDGNAYFYGQDTLHPRSRVRRDSVYGVQTPQEILDWMDVIIDHMIAARAGD